MLKQDQRYQAVGDRGQRRARCIIPHREEDGLRQDSGVARNLDLPAW